MDRIPKWVLVVGALKIFGFSLPSFSDLKQFASVALSGDGNETFYEELLNSVTHGVGTLMAVISLYFLTLLAIHYRRSWHHWVGLTIYGLSLVLLYACSTIYHVAGLVFENDQEKMYFYRQLDHIGIFYLIAGSYTPLVLLIMIKKANHKISGALLLGFVWGCAAVKLLVHINDAPLWVHASFYLLMGFAVVFAFKPVVEHCPSVILFYLGLGGFFYSFGVIFLLWDSLQFNHGIWHLFVMLGSINHFISIMLSTLPHLRRQTEHYTFKTAPQQVKGAIDALIAESLDGHEKRPEQKSFKSL